MTGDTMTADEQLQPAGHGLLKRGVMRPVEPRMVAALYVEPKGCYVGVQGVLESRHATQDTRSQKGVPSRVSSRKARKGKADDRSMEGRKPGARISKRESLERQERRQTSGIQGCIPRKEQGRHSRRSAGVERKSWVQRSQEKAGRERAAAASHLRIDARVLRTDVGRSRRRMRHLSEQRSRHEARQSALCGPLSHNKPRTWASLPSMQHHARRGQRLPGNITSWGCLS